MIAIGGDAIEQKGNSLVSLPIDRYVFHDTCKPVTQSFFNDAFHSVSKGCKAAEGLRSILNKSAKERQIFMGHVTRCIPVSLHSRV